MRPTNGARTNRHAGVRYQLHRRGSVRTLLALRIDPFLRYREHIVESIEIVTCRKASGLVRFWRVRNRHTE